MGTGGAFVLHRGVAGLGGLLRPSRQKTWLAVLLLVLVFLVFTFSTFNRYLVNDDYQTLYTAWLKSRGAVPGKDYFLASYYLILDIIAPLFWVAPGSWFPLYASRLLLLGVMVCMVIPMIKIGTRWFGRETGLIAPLLALSCSAMLHRGLDLRPDLLTVFLWLWLLARVTEKRTLTGRGLVLSGVLLTLCLLNRFKGVMIFPLALTGLFWTAWKSGIRGRRGLARMAGWLALGVFLSLAVYAVWISLTDGIPEFLRIQGLLYRDIKALYGDGQNALWSVLWASLEHDWFYWLLALSGVVLRLRHFRRYTLQSNALVLGLLLTAMGSVILNPAYYAYNLVTLQVILAFFPAYIVVRVFRRLRNSFPRWPRLLLWGACVSGPVLINAGVMVDVARPSNVHQKELARFIREQVPGTKGVFALEGVGLFRPSVFHWRIPAVLHHRYAKGEWSYARELSETPVELVVVSYRVPGWLSAADSKFLADHYVPLTPLLLVPGFDTRGVQGTLEFKVLCPGEFECLSSPGATGRLDGSPFLPNRIISLSPGNHILEDVRGRLMLRRVVPRERLALVSNPRGLPYFTVPGLEMPEPVVFPR